VVVTVAYGEQSLDGAVPASGELSLTFGPGARTRAWSVQQVSVEMSTAPIGATCELRKGDRLVTYLIATGDTAGGDPPVQLQGAERLTVTWKGCTPAATGRVFAIYDDGK
jgi:hypothetical protein